MTLMRKAILWGIATVAMSAPAAVVINEVDSDTPTSPTNDNAEFVELYNSGGSAVDLAAGGYVLVLYNGSADTSYLALDLTGPIAAGGYRVFGNTGVPGAGGEWPADTLQNGADAVALYSGTSASAFPSGTAVTATNLVDAIVYDTADPDDTGLLTALTPSQPQVNESANGLNATQSNQRIPDGQGGALVTTGYLAATPTPNAANSAPAGPVATLNVTQVDFGLWNATNVGSPATRRIRITNSGGGTLNVTAFGLQVVGASQFTAGAPSVALPAAVAAGASVEFVLSYENSDFSADQTFNGTITYTSDGGSGTAPVTATFVRVLQLASPGQVVINELSYNPNPGSPNPIQDYNGDGLGESTNDEFVELFNTTASPINMQGWELTATSGSPTAIVETTVLPVGAVLPAGGFAVFFGGGTPTGFAPGVAFVGKPALGNGGEILTISDNTTIIDDVAFVSEEANNGTGTDAGVISVGGSIGLYPDGTMPYIEFVWDAILGPTPGDSNGTVTSVGQFELYR